MSAWRQVMRGTRRLVRGAAADADIVDEVQHYLDEAAAAHEARGLAPDAARRAARLEAGGAAVVAEQVRDYGWEQSIATVWADLRYAVRRLWSEKAFTAVAVVTLAVGIGATTAIFSAVNPILIQPLPYPQAGRIVTIVETMRDGFRNGGTFAMYREFVERLRSLDAVAVYKPWQPAITGSAEPERLDGQRVSAGFFRVLGVAPLLGRDFTAADDRASSPNVVILSDSLWRRRFAADPAIVGRTITLDDNPYTVIGVMGRGFESVLAPDAVAWAPLQYDMSQGRAWGHHLRTIGRLNGAASFAALSAEVNAVGRPFAAAHPAEYGITDFVVATLQADVTRAVRPALLVVLGAVSLVLIIACVNVTNLLLARGVHRRTEFAVRTALGAGRRRLLRQLLTEALVLALVGGGAGMIVAFAGVRALVALSPPGLPRVSAIGVDTTALVFGLLVSAVVAVVFGIIPALQVSRRDPQDDLRFASRAGGAGHARTRAVLVVAEVALALVLLVGSGLLLRSLTRLFAVDAGFDASRVLTMQVQITGHRFDDYHAPYRFFDAALDAVRRLPGVASAALTTQLPLSGDRDEYGAHFEPTPTQPAVTYSVFRYAVSPAYFDTMRIPVLEGRLFDQHDLAGAPPVAVISRSLARRRFAGASPLGGRVRIGPNDGAAFTIVGVVGDVRQVSLSVQDADAIYVPAGAATAAIHSGPWHYADTVMTLVVRTPGEVGGLAPAVRQAVWSVDKDQPIVRVSRLQDIVAASAAERRFALVLFEAFALAALLLAGAGMYGLLAGSVAERTREIGVRAALGASTADILRLVVRQALQLTSVGVAAGLVAAALASRAIAAMLFGISPLDAPTYAGVALLLAVVALIASGVPAWRAVRVDPASTLRAE